MKNFKLIKGASISEGMILLDLASKNAYAPFSKYVANLLDKGLANNTIESYTSHAARFLDFLYEIQLQPSLLTDDIKPTSIFELYYDFLAFGLNADNPLISQLARKLNKTKQISNEIISGQITSALDYLLHTLEVDNNTGFLEHFQLDKNLTDRQKSKIQSSSWFAQCIRKTPNPYRESKKTVLFPRSLRVRKINIDSSDTYEKAFQSNDAFNFLLKQKFELDRKMTLSKSRNYLLDSLQAASGIRVSEALQVQLQDIDIERKKVNVISIDKRGFDGLTQKEAEKLVFKGRQTEKTLLIEPFASLFWDALKLYLEHYYKSNMNHQFLFQKVNGRPFFASDESTRCKDFKSRLTKHMGNTLASKYSSHSYRHMYGVYTSNHIPIMNEDGLPTGQYGLPVGYVKILMGHASISSTARYARKDNSVAELLLTLANNKIKYSGLTLKDIILDVKTKKLEEIKSAFEELEPKGELGD
ncbi:site-specific integrase [Vibrio parahaemolyticus]|nr:site-specific integrase [Vibrio parahaemolyticus]